MIRMQTAIGGATACAGIGDHKKQVDEVVGQLLGRLADTVKSNPELQAEMGNVFASQTPHTKDYRDAVRKNELSASVFCNLYLRAVLDGILAERSIQEIINKNN